jgi:hypothetical protein
MAHAFSFQAGVIPKRGISTPQRRVPGLPTSLAPQLALESLGYRLQPILRSRCPRNLHVEASAKANRMTGPSPLQAATLSSPDTKSDETTAPEAEPELVFQRHPIEKTVLIQGTSPEMVHVVQEHGSRRRNHSTHRVPEGTKV